jgi:type IV secretory pathway TraG/TraD family ATPase VirD4
MLMGSKGGERGLRYIEDPTSKQALSVLSVLMQYTKCFEYMAGAEGDFSIKKWLDEGRGWIYVTNYAEVQDTLRPVLTLFIDILGKRLLSLKDDYHRRVFIILDELGTLQRLSTIVQLLTLSRSKGGSVWIGIQDIGQIDKLYTEPLRQAMVNACGITVVFSVAEPETAAFLSKKIGDISYLKTDETCSMAVESHRDGIALSRSQKEEKLVLPSEIMNLRDLECYVKVPNYDISQTTLTYRAFKESEEPLLLREDLILTSGSGEACEEDTLPEVSEVRQEVEDTMTEERDQSGDTLFSDSDETKQEGEELKRRGVFKLNLDMRGASFNKEVSR